jgi:hypothetical protein
MTVPAAVPVDQMDHDNTRSRETQQRKDELDE